MNDADIPAWKQLRIQADQLQDARWAANPGIISVSGGDAPLPANMQQENNLRNQSAQAFGTQFSPTQPLAGSPNGGVAQPLSAPQPLATPPALGNSPALGAPPASTNPSGIIGGNQGSVSITPSPSMSVESRMASLMNPNSQLGQIAKTSALQQMNERGLANSSIALTAGQDALYRNVLPIAQQDAQLGYDLGKTNNAYANQFARDNNLQINDLQKMARSQGYNLDNMSVQQMHDLVKLSTNQGYTTTNKAADQANTVQMQGIQSKYANILQGNAQASNLMNTASNAINNISNNNQMDANAKTEFSNQIYNNLNTQLQILSATAGLNLGPLLNPYPASGQAAPTPQTSPVRVGGGTADQIYSGPPG